MEPKAWRSKLTALKGGPWLAIGALVMALLSLAWPGHEPVGAASEKEARIAQVLSQIQGAGAVEVALYYENQSASSLWEEAEAPALQGAVIVAQGGGDIEVKMKLIRATATLLGLENKEICVFPMGEGGGT